VRFPRRSVLGSSAAIREIHALWTDFDARGDTTTLAATVMPDHFHWLFMLGPRLSLGRVLAKFKTHTGKLLNVAGAEWQRDFFEHRLRESESAEGYGFYIFMNPYRARLIAIGAPWPGWHCPRPDRFSFSSMLDSAGSPPPQWLELPVDERLRVGA
jgi:REP element-mobilizing transposase RayT